MPPKDRGGAPTRGRPASPVRTGAGRPAKVDLPREIVDELRQMVRGGRADEAIADLSRAVVLLAREDVTGAAKEAQKAKRLAPRSAAVREVLGLAYYGQGRYREAMTELQAYRRMSGRQDQNHIIADCYRGVGQPEKAVPLAEEELRARIPATARAEAAVVGAAALADIGKYEQALAMLRRFADRAEGRTEHDLRVLYVMGDVLARAGRRDEAADAFREVVRHEPGAYDAAERLAELS